MDTLLMYFEITPFSSVLVLIGSVLILFAALKLVRHTHAVQQKNEEVIEHLKRDVRALTKAAVGVGQRVLEVERGQKKRAAPVPVPTTQRVQPVQPPEVYEPANQPYERAISMARNGATQKDLVNICGLSANEAELIAMLHRWDKIA